MSEHLSECSDACRWQRRKEDRPAEILAAALRLFSAKGFTSTKLDEVAKEAGVSKGTVYLYFESKEALLKAVVTEFVLPHIVKAEEAAADYSGNIKDLIKLLTEQWQDKILNTELCGIPKLIISEAANFPELAEFYLKNVIKRVRKFISQLIELGIERGEFRDCNSDYLARSFLSAMVFAAIWQRSLATFDDKYDVEQYLNTHVEIVLRGISKDTFV